MKIDEDEAVWLEALSASNIRLTSARRSVVAVMRRHPGRLYPEELAAECSTGRATVYRMLKLLADKGLLCRVVRDNGAVFYHVSTLAHRQHIVCSRCGSVEEIELPELDAGLAQALTKTGYEALDFRLEASGICPGCTSHGSQLT